MPPRIKHVANKPTTPRGRGRRGGSSSGRANDEEVPIELPRFMTREHGLVFESDFKRRSICKGKIISLPSLSVGNLFVGNLLNNLGWTTFLTLNKSYYPELVKEFYANMSIDKETLGIQSRVNHKDIFFTKDNLRTMLGLPEGDITPPHVANAWPSFGTFEPRTDLKILVANKNLTFFANPPEYNQLNLNARITLNIITHNILPHSGSKTHVSRYECFLMYSIFTGIHLCLASLIIQHMWSVPTKSHMSLPYPSLLTHIFEQLGVDLSEAIPQHYSHLDNLNSANIRKMGYTKDSENSDIWVLKTGEPDEYEGTWLRPVAESPSRVRQRTNDIPEDVPSGSQSFPDHSFYSTYQANHESQMNAINALMGSVTNLSSEVTGMRTDIHSLQGDVHSLQGNYYDLRHDFDDYRTNMYDFRTTMYGRLDTIDDRMGQWDQGNFGDGVDYSGRDDGGDGGDNDGGNNDGGY